MRRIAKWLRARGYRLISGAEWCCDTEAKTITYRRGVSRRLRLVMLLHECGHVLCVRHRGRKFKHYFGRDVRLRHASILHEELEAWHRGYALAKRLGVRVPERVYWREYGCRIRGYAFDVVEKRI